MGSKVPTARNGIPARVYLLGIVSFFNDIASEMLYPIMPIFLTQVLNAPVFVLGIIEGVAEGIAAFFKSYFGFLSDKLQLRKPFVVAGYGTSAVARLVIALAFVWPVVFLGRVLDRLGKGIRTGARDALLLEASTPQNKGLVFGVHRTFDSAGAVVGPLVALGLLNLFDNDLRMVLIAAIFPAFFALFFFIFIRESRNTAIKTGGKNSLALSLKGFTPELKLFLVTFALFSLGNSSDSFLILRSQQLGMSITLVVLVYVVYTLLSTPAGYVADKIGPQKVFMLGLLLYTGVYLAFALNTDTTLIWLLFPVYGGYIALTDGVSKALIGNYVKKGESGAAYGTFQATGSIFTLLASVTGGILWSEIGPAATFYFGAACALAALVVFTLTPSSSKTV